MGGYAGIYKYIKKDLTNMDYKEKYKHALKRARTGLHDCNLLNCDDMTRKAAITTIYHLFPELTEDEDERIRKGIIRNLQYLMDRSEGFVKEDLQERIDWLEKQGEVAYNPYKATVESIANMCNKYATKMSNKEDANDFLQNVKVKCKDAIEFEKQGEQPTDKVEPKFHVGDWIISNNKKSTYQVIEVKRGIYVIRDNADNHEYHIGIEECEKSGRLWTINDAKDGDVLVSESTCGLGTWYCIFKSLDGDESMTVYCYLARDWRFETKKELCFDKNPYNTNPATKKQRDLLFRKMKEAGYVWDNEKKELKEI